MEAAARSHSSSYFRCRFLSRLDLCSSCIYKQTTNNQHAVKICRLYICPCLRFGWTQSGQFEHKAAFHPAKTHILKDSTILILDEWVLQKCLLNLLLFSVLNHIKVHFTGSHSFRKCFIYRFDFFPIFGGHLSYFADNIKTLFKPNLRWDSGK